MSTTPTLTQNHFRVRTDTGGAGATPIWGAAQNTAVTWAVETTFRIRFVVSNTGTAAGAGPYILRVSKNAGAYTAVTTSTGATLGAQSESTASSSADEVSINTTGFRLTAGSGTAANGIYDETGSATLSLTNGFFTELEYGLILKTAGATAGDTFDFRVYNSTTAFASYTQTPRITVRALATGTNFNEKSVLSSYASDYNAAGHTTSVVTIAASGGGAVGDLAVLTYTADNSSTITAGGLSGFASVADSKGNTWTECYSVNFSPGGALSGSNAGIYYSQLTTALDPADTVTATWQVATEANRDAVALTVKMFAVAASKTVTVEATNYATGNAGTPPSLDATTASVECLRVRITGFESNATQQLSSTGWTQLPVVTGDSGTSTLSQSLSGEFKISTGTSDASTPVAGATVDMASVYVAFRADTSGLTACLANDVSSASSVSSPSLALTATSTAPGAHLVTSFTPGTGRQDFTGELGLQAHMIANQTVTWIGLLMQSTYTGIHQLALRQTDGTLITSTAFDCTGKTASTWYWVPIPPTALVSGNYYVVTQKVTNSDGQLWPNAGATTLDAALSDEARAVFRTTGAFDAGVANAQYAGLDLGWTPPANHACLANDVASASSVTQPALGEIVKLATRMHQYRMRRA